MKQKLKIIIPTIVVLFIGFMAYKISAKISHKEEIAKNIKTLPEFYFYKLGSENIFTNTDLEQNKATLIIHFHPECDYCQNEAKYISKRVDDFKDFQLLFISYADTKQIKIFAKKHDLLGIANITFLEDKDMIFNDIFGKSGKPASFIYNKQDKLVKQFKGEVKVDALLKYLKE